MSCLLFDYYGYGAVSGQKYADKEAARNQKVENRKEMSDFLNRDATYIRILKDKDGRKLFNELEELVLSPLWLEHLEDENLINPLDPMFGKL